MKLFSSFYNTASKIFGASSMDNSVSIHNTVLNNNDEIVNNIPSIVYQPISNTVQKNPLIPIIETNTVTNVNGPKFSRNLDDILNGISQNNITNASEIKFSDNLDDILNNSSKDNINNAIELNAIELNLNNTAIQMLASFSVNQAITGIANYLHGQYPQISAILPNYVNDAAKIVKDALIDYYIQGNEININTLTTSGLNHVLNIGLKSAISSVIPGGVIGTLIINKFASEAANQISDKTIELINLTTQNLQYNYHYGHAAKDSSISAGFTTHLEEDFVCIKVDTLLNTAEIEDDFLLIGDNNL